MYKGKPNCSICLWGVTTLYEIYSRRSGRQVTVTFLKFSGWSSLTWDRGGMTVLQQNVQSQTTLLFQFCCMGKCGQLWAIFCHLLPTASICTPVSCLVCPVLALFQNISQNHTRRGHLWLLFFQFDFKVTNAQTVVAYQRYRQAQCWISKLKPNKMSHLREHAEQASKVLCFSKFL